MNLKPIHQTFFLIFVFNLLLTSSFCIDPEKPLIFPVPNDMQIIEGKFAIDKSTVILLPEKESKADDFLARFLFNIFTDRYAQPVPILNKPAFTTNDKFILIGDLSNPLVKKYCEQKNLLTSLKTLGDEGYILNVSDKSVVVAANNKNGALLGLSSLRQIISKENGTLFIQKLIVKDKPKYSFRGIKLYLPGRENITFFKRFIKDFVSLYKYNTIILELNANMRLDRHPELNIGAVEFERHLNFSRLDRPPGQHMEYQNSSHQDNGDGEILEKEEVADIVAYMRKFNIEVIPELPSLTHAYYLLAGHKDLAENMAQEYPDTYCPLKPESYKIFFDVLDEYIDVIHPKIIHVGHDEWRMEKDLCELCRGKDYGQLYSDDITKIHDYLAKKGITTAIWGDHLLESVTKKEYQVWKSSAGYQYKIPGALRPEQVLKLIPKDILIFNWFWNKISNDQQVSDFGFKQVYGNFRADINDWSERDKIKGLLGGAPSSWAGTTEKNFGKDQLYDFLGCANLLWSNTYLSTDKLTFITESMAHEVNINFSGKILPGDNGSKITPVSISPYLNSPVKAGIPELDISELSSGDVKKGNKTFKLSPPDGNGNRAILVETRKDGTGYKSVQGIQINQDVNSLIFLHACAKVGSNKKAYAMIFNFDDTAELLGWYEIVYEDGFVETIPIRYGVNILDWRWRARVLNNEPTRIEFNQNHYAYNATSVDCSKDDSKPVTFFAYEWENSRYGKKITQVNLKSVNYNRNNDNAIMLIAISVAENTKREQAKGTENL
jgi:hypothetical protein